MFEYMYGKKLTEELLFCYRNKLIEAFAQEYDIESNRLWNCLRKKRVCLEFEDARRYNIPKDVILYLERQNSMYSTTFEDVCRYVDELEPWEYIDAYVFDDTLNWLFAITHEDLKCLIVGL